MPPIFSPHDIASAVSTNFIDYLKTLGFHPVSEKVDRALFHSPLRTDRHPSFSVGCKDGRWIWHDFATGESADLITFVQRYHHMTFREAVAELLTHGPSSPSLPQESLARKPCRTTTANIKRWYLTQRDRQSSRDEHRVREYFVRHHLPWYPELGSILLMVTPDTRRSNLTIPYVAIPVPSANMNEFQALECRALYSVPTVYRRRCFGPKGLWRFSRSDRPLLITESVVDCLAADHLFGPTLDLLSLNSIRNCALVPQLLAHSTPPHIILALDNDRKANRGEHVEQQLLQLLKPFALPLSHLTLHHRTGYKDLHKVLLAHPTHRFMLDHYLTAPRLNGSRLPTSRS